MAKLFGRDDVALGIKLPFGSGQSNFALNYTTLDQAKTDVVNLLLTHKGERFMQPRFGTNLRRFLFQPNTSRLEGEIREEVDPGPIFSTAGYRSSGRRIRPSCP